ncbi:uncharacterized protein (DUF2384 family) [Rhodanobacter sp. MP7CTX1]|jgi:uncharacterized protein (DUF2384 family)|nr:uncharacterized protein (DUF2384 family) [Rhodanobacter sp. MP7CTX1]
MMSQSDRTVRIARVFAEAATLFGDEQMAKNWFAAPAQYMIGEPAISPMFLSVTDSGARLMDPNIRQHCLRYLLTLSAGGPRHLHDGAGRGYTMCTTFEP